MHKKSKYFALNQRRHREITRMFEYFSKEPICHFSNIKKNLDDYDQNPEKDGIETQQLQNNTNEK